MDPPHDPLNPWEIARKQKKQKTSYIGGFFKKKDEKQVREEREAADARAAAAQAEADSRRLEAAHKYNLLVAKWQLPPRPSLVRGLGESGRTLVATTLVATNMSFKLRCFSTPPLSPYRISLTPLSLYRLSLPTLRTSCRFRGPNKKLTGFCL